MIKNVVPQRLKYFLSLRGPYILYSNGECSGSNGNLVKIMHEMNYKLNGITFLETKWNEFKIFQRIKEEYEINYIYCYYNGKQVLCERYPDHSNLKIFFNKCIELYNNAIDLSISKIVKKSFYKDGCLIPVNELETRLNKKNEYKYIIKKLVKKKIQIQNFDILSPPLTLETDTSECWFKDIKNVYLTSNILDDNILDLSDTESNKSINIINNKTKNELPNDGFSPSKNYSLNNDKITIDTNLTVPKFLNIKSDSQDFIFLKPLPQFKQVNKNNQDDCLMPTIKYISKSPIKNKILYKVDNNKWNIFNNEYKTKSLENFISSVESSISTDIISSKKTIPLFYYPIIHKNLKNVNQSNCSLKEEKYKNSTKTKIPNITFPCNYKKRFLQNELINQKCNKYNNSNFKQT